MQNSKLIENIHNAIDSIEKIIDSKDPSGMAWDLRVNTCYGMFHILNAPRFKLEPVNLDDVLTKLIEIKNQLDSSNELISSENIKIFDPLNDPDETSSRQQYLYGVAWSKLNRNEYYDAANLLESRLVNSNIDISFINDAMCLDMATGIARWAVALVQMGAKKVIATDYSKECLEGAKQRLAGSIESQSIELKWADIYDMPKDTYEAFDFVVANGVIHHLPDPKGGLESMANCTKKNGRGFTFVFSKNDTPWWACIESMRRLMAPVSIEYANKILKFYNTPGGMAFNVLDYSYTPIQFKFEKEWFEDSLRDVGFKKIQYLEGGSIHDSNLRNKLFDTDKVLYGISEMRYLVQK